MGTELNLIPKQTFDASALVSGTIADARLYNKVMHKFQSQLVTNSITLVDDNALHWDVKNGDYYHLYLALRIDGPVAGGFRFKLNPSAGSFSIFGFCQDAIGILAAGGTLPYADLTTAKIYATISADPTFILVEGYIEAMDDGTITLQWAQGTANATATRLEVGSFAILHGAIPPP